jgi:hypothetical protein
MIFAINPGMQFEAYKAAAMRIGFNVVGQARSINEVDKLCDGLVTTTSLSMSEKTATPHHSSGNLRTANTAGLAIMATLGVFMCLPLVGAY